MHSFHLVTLPPVRTARVLGRGLGAVDGLRHAEPMATMRLGAPVVSPERMQLRRLAMFCAWESEDALEAFLAGNPLGPAVSDGWHVRLRFLRRWGHVEELGDLPEVAERSRPAEPVVAFTLARMRLTRVPRFVRWGRPVERQVRDHPASPFATAAMRPPHTVATFSTWRSAREMTAMVAGRDVGAQAERHRAAMLERERRDFHHAFTTLRFRPLSEHGTWDGRSTLLR